MAKNRKKALIIMGLLVAAAILLSRPLHDLIPYKYDKGGTAADHLSQQRLKIMTPERLATLINPQPASTVLDIGAGYGALTFPVARMVGPSGKVFATDVEPQVISYLSRQSAKEKVDNVCPVKVSAVGVDAFYAEHSYDLIILSDVLPDIVMPDRFVSKIRPTLKTQSGRLWAIVSKVDPDFTSIELEGAPDLPGTISSAQLQQTVGRRLQPSTRQALETRPGEALKTVLVQDLNRMLDDPTLWPEAQANKWPLSGRYGALLQGLGGMLQREGVFDGKPGSIGESARHRLRLLNRLVLMDMLHMNLWGEAVVWIDLSDRDAKHLLAKLDASGCPDQAVLSLFQHAGYQLVKEHQTMPYYSVFEFMNGTVKAQSAGQQPSKRSSASFRSRPPA
ncbi:MAG TPA: class I SAM-dependent methyltransferase [Geomonas sp.]|nr:class I SAM-dependent methyltransferase [Geomonas sp.]